MKRAFIHGTILTCDAAFRIHRDAVLCTDGETIVSVGAAMPSGFHPEETIDCTGSILLPGLVNAHVHLGEHLFRGWMDETSFEGLFYSTLFRWESQLSFDDVLCASRCAAAEAAKAGVTAVADLYHHPQATAQALIETGLRGLVGGKILGFALQRPPRQAGGAIDYRFEWEAFREHLDGAEAFADQWHGADAQRITAALCPHATNTLTADMLSQVADRAGRLHLPIHMHLAQMASERETVLERDGIGCVALLDRCGILEQPFLGAHGIFVAPEELYLLERPTATVVHNPIPNAKDAGLIAPMTGYQRAGVRIALGTDAFRMDLLETARFAACIQRTTVQSGTAFPAREVLQWATLGGAAALGLEDRIGSLEPGKAADLVVLKADGVESLSCGDPHTQALYYGSPGSIQSVYVDGRLIVHNGQLQRVDEGDIRHDFADRMTARWREEGRS